MKTTIHYIIRKARTGEFIAPWDIKLGCNKTGCGQPTAENLSKWRDQFNNSLLKGGVNEHLGVNSWLQCRLEIYDQISKEIICTYNSPMFEVIPNN